MTEDRRQQPDRREWLRGGRRAQDRATVIAIRLRAAMRAKPKMTRRRLAHLSGLNERTVRRVLDGDTDMKLGTLEALAVALGLSVERLIEIPPADSSATT